MLKIRSSIATAISAAMIASVSASALAEVNVKTTGEVIGTVGYIKINSADQVVTTNATHVGVGSDAKVAQSTDAKIGIQADILSDNGLKSGALVEFDTNNFGISTSENGKIARVSRSFMYVDSAAGRVELGNNSTVSYLMDVGASTISASPVTSSDFLTDQVSSSYYTNTNLHLDRSSSLRKFNKVAYYAPEMFGLKLAVDYGSNSQNTASADSFYGKAYTTAYTGVDGALTNLFTDVITAAAQYNYSNGAMSAQLGATAQFGTAKKNNAASPTTAQEHHNLNAYKVGATFAYENYKFAGSYTNSSKSGMAKSVTTDNKAHAYDLGASYEQGPITVSLTGMRTKAHGNKLKALDLTTSYAVAQGTSVFLEGTTFKVGTKKPKVFLLGAKVFF